MPENNFSGKQVKFSVLQVGKFYPPYRGGMETYLFDLCQGLKERVKLEVLVANDSRRTIREEVDGVKVVRAGSFGKILATSLCPSFPRLLREHAADIVTVHHPNPLATLAYLKARPPGRLTVVYHSDIVKQKLTEIFYRPLLLKFIEQAERISVTSPHYIDGSPILRRFREKCVVIPIGIDLSLFEETEEIASRAREIRRTHGERTVLFIGRMTLYKGIEYLVKAMESVNGKLLVVGSGERFDALKMMVVSHGLEDRVALMSAVSRTDLLAYLRACSVFCLPSISRNEAFGIVQLEAMASSRPVVSSRLDTGITYSNLDGITGLVVPPGDPPALARALNRILDDPALAEEMGRRGRKRVEEEFTKEKMAERTFLMYREMLG
ncbi:MAG: glycosyltransferase [Candidatus Erginobacter occultus]|nr:glycosyltransferase [Candidatus Erginobacter occultus]